jgi:hypothetical protein
MEPAVYPIIGKVFSNLGRASGSKTVIPENASAFIRDLNKHRPELVKFPDNASGVSGMTAGNCATGFGIPGRGARAEKKARLEAALFDGTFQMAT